MRAAYRPLMLDRLSVEGTTYRRVPGVGSGRDRMAIEVR